MRYRDIVEHAMLAPDFAQWFQGSKVVDDEGKPLRCYHGTMNTFEEFYVGSHFGDIVAANQRIDDRKREGDTMFAGHSGLVYPVYLSIKNPLRIEDDGGLIDGADLAKAVFRAKAITHDELEKMRVDGPFTSGVKMRKSLFALLTVKGFDGLVYRNIIEGDADSWVIFRAEQVRTATLRG